MHKAIRFISVAPAILGLALLSAGCELAFTDLSAQSKDEWTRTYALSADGRVEIVNVNGEIDVEPSTDGKVHVRAERTAKASTQEAAKELLTKIQIREDATAERVRLETQGPPRGILSGGHYSVRYWVNVPATASVRVENTNGRVRVTDLAGPVEASTTNGGVSGHGLKGRVEASTTNGGVEMDVDAVHAEGIRLETTNGGVSLTLPSSAKADIEAEVTNGGIDTGSLNIERAGESTRRKLDGRLNGGGPRVRLETTNGGVHITGKS
jgi:hypothetical protein